MHPAIIKGTVRSLWTWLWGRYHVPQNVFLVYFYFSTVAAYMATKVVYIFNLSLLVTRCINKQHDYRRLTSITPVDRRFRGGGSYYPRAGPILRIVLGVLLLLKHNKRWRYDASSLLMTYYNVYVIQLWLVKLFPGAIRSAELNM